MGQVFAGLSPGGRVVAVKMVHPEHLRDPEFASRFRREVQANRMVSGAYTASVIDADTSASPPWLVTAYVPGPSLQEMVRANGPLPTAAVIALAAGLAEALMSIHAASLVHRDLKPSNVLLAEDGPRVIDFGIARISGTSTITKDGFTVGSPGFMSPEQVNTGAITPASDVFSLGAVLVYAATGASPFGGGAYPAMLYRVVHTEPDLEAVTDPTLRALAADCLAKTPEQRPSPEEILARVGFGGGRTTLLEAGAWSPVADRIHTSDQAMALADTVARTVPDAPPVRASAPPTLAPPALPGGTTAPRGRPRRTVVLAALAAAVGAGVPAGLYLTRPAPSRSTKLSDPSHTSSSSTPASKPASVPPPAGAWRLDEPSGSTIAHDTAGDHDGRATSVGWGQGPDGSAWFDGSASEVVTRGPVLDTGPGSSFTVSAWVRLADVPGWFATVVSQSAGGVIAFYLQYSSAENLWAFSDQAVRATSSRVPRLNVWTHLVGVREGNVNQLLLYVDGVKQNAVATGFSQAAEGSDSLFIGRALNADEPSDWFPGGIRDVRVFDRALTPAQVEALHRG